jgi:hypothetical protein
MRGNGAEEPGVGPRPAGREGVAVWRVVGVGLVAWGAPLLSTIPAILVSSRSRDPILEMIKSESCLISEGGSSTRGGEDEGERGRAPMSGSLKVAMAEGGTESSSMALPGAWKEAAEDLVSASKSIAGRGSADEDEAQSMGADVPRRVVSSSSAAGREEGSGVEALFVTVGWP